MSLVKSFINSYVNSSNLSIVLSGRNIKKYLEVNTAQIERLFPHLKKCITIFDDESTDDTVVWAKSKKYKVITWKYNLNSERVNISVRVNQIYTEIMKQINTKYVWFVDGDIIYKDDYFFYESFEQILFHDAKIVGLSDASIPYESNLEYIEKYNLYNYLSNIRQDYTNNKLSNIKFKNNRIWLGSTIMDLSYFKNIGLYFDDIKDPEERKHYEHLLTGWFDSGSYFFSKILERKIKYSVIKFINNKHLIHFGGRSCYQFNKDNDWGKSYIYPISKLIDSEENKEIKELLSTYKFNYKEFF